jgi:hypothetical protein
MAEARIGAKSSSDDKFSLSALHLVAVGSASRRLKVKLDPSRVLFSLRHQHNGIPPDFELLLFGDAQEWLGAVTTTC